MKILILICLLICIQSKASEEDMNINGAVSNYQLRSINLTSGGGTIESGVYKLTSSIGQMEASNEVHSGNFKLQSGFLNQVRSIDFIFKSSFE